MLVNNYLELWFNFYTAMFLCVMDSQIDATFVYKITNITRKFSGTAGWGIQVYFELSGSLLQILCSKTTQTENCYCSSRRDIYKLGTKQGLLKGVYSRNQFEPLPEPLLQVSDVNHETEVALRSEANKQSQGGGQSLLYVVA